MNTFKILGIFLSYPEENVLKHQDELLTVLKEEGLLPKKALSQLEAFCRSRAGKDIYELQADYVELFDRGRSHCLHLFEHIHGESRDRGQAMVNLVETYEEKGLYIQTGELPDFLPLFLEYLSLCPLEEAIALLGEPINVIGTIGARLEKRHSAYAALFNALEMLSKVKPDAHVIEEVRKAEPEDTSLEALDREWEEADAFDNGDLQGADCTTCNAFPETTAALQSMAGGK